MKILKLTVLSFQITHLQMIVKKLRKNYLDFQNNYLTDVII